jgi:uncharacterized protein YggE
MNRRVTLSLAALFFVACQPAQDDRVYIDIGDAEDYMDWLQYDRDDEEPVPFKADPLAVTGKGQVRATPDIAVITARISSESKNESEAFNEVSETINNIQEVLVGRSAETGFTALRSTPQYDQRCRNENQLAWQRHNQIRADYFFNKRLDDQGDTKTKRRDPKPRLAQSVCKATEIEVSSNMVIRLSPPDAVGDVLQALAQVGAENAQLYGYDFTNYDALYQEAASKAVSDARRKAEMIARITKAELEEIVGFYVGRPARTGRFGPQPAIVNKSGLNVYAGEGFGAAPPPPPPPMPSMARWDGALMDDSIQDEIVVTGSRRRSTGEIFQELVDDGSQESSGPSSSNNALNMTLLSGPQTITVTAALRYDYKTVIDGAIVPNDE